MLRIVTGLSLITANIPLLRPFLKRLQSGYVLSGHPLMADIQFAI